MADTTEENDKQKSLVMPGLIRFDADSEFIVPAERYEEMRRTVDRISCLFKDSAGATNGFGCTSFYASDVLMTYLKAVIGKPYRHRYVWQYRNEHNGRR